MPVLILYLELVKGKSIIVTVVQFRLKLLGQKEFIPKIIPGM